jgi:uncharacterized membrane protein
MAETQVNVGDTERRVSTIAGAALAIYGLSRRSFGGALAAAIGAGMIYRGTTGPCAAYSVAGVSTASQEQKPGQDGIQVIEVVTINKSPDELFTYWRNFENLPQFMNHLESVAVQDNTHSHWVATAPLGQTVNWDAEIINEIPGRLIAWQSVPGSGIASAGSVRFEPAPGNRGTEVRVNLEYNPPAGTAGAIIARLLGEEPRLQVAEDLRRFKNLMEAGETPSVAGQPMGERSAKGRMLDKIQVTHAA